MEFKRVSFTARHLLELNLLSLENISRATGLSIDELKKPSNSLVKEAHKAGLFDAFSQITVTERVHRVD